MPKAAIVIDEYKLGVFKRILEKEGFALGVSGAINPKHLTLAVYFNEKDAQKLSNALALANNQIFIGKLN